MHLKHILGDVEADGGNLHCGRLPCSWFLIASTLGTSMPSAGGVHLIIKEQQLDLFADRTSAATMRANQLRLWFASFAYVLLEALRRIGLRHTQFQDATCGTIRLKLLKLGARVTVSVRRIKIAIASACPYRTEFALAHLRLASWTGPPAARTTA